MDGLNALLHPFHQRIKHSSVISASGGMGDVYKGFYERDDGTTEIVALKTFRVMHGQSQDDINRRLPREATIWGRASHGRVIPFHGVCPILGRIALVSPWLDNGTINRYLEENKMKSDRGLILHLLKQAIDGIQHLHTVGIVHGDIKGNNILIDEEGNAKITDFGRAFIVDEIHATQSYLGTTPYLSPEIAAWPEDEKNPGRVPLTKMGDMWALGITVLELFDDLKPWEGKGIAKLLTKILGGQRPQKADFLQTDSVKGLWRCVNKCWEYKPNDRIMIDDFRARIQPLSV